MIHRSVCVLAVIALSFSAASAERLPEIDSEALKAAQDTCTPLDGTTPAHPRVIWVHDPATRATISWSTQEAGSTHRVYYDTEPREGKLDAYRFHADAARSGAYTTGQKPKDGEQLTPPAYYHHTPLEKLTPSTTYYFVMVSDNSISRELHFVTAPGDDRPFTVLYGGDSRSDESNRCRVNITMRRLVEADGSIIAVAHGGDYIASGRSWGQWERWMRNHELTITQAGRALPVIPARGNHDGGPLFDQVFDTPGGEKRNYWVTRLSPQATLVTLNSNISAAGDQREWLAEQLKTLRPINRWLLAQYHRPVYPAVKSPGSGRKAWVPLFEQYNLDVALEADGHCIKRTVPIRNEKHAADGVTYLGEGGFGVPQRTPDTKRWYLNEPGMADKGHHVMVLRFTPESIDYETLMLDGSARDAHTFKPRPESARGGE